MILAAISGLSNRVGTTVKGAAEIARLLGAETALLVDNGADVTLCFEDQLVLRSTDVQRDRWRSLLLFRSSESLELRFGDLQLVRYPKVYAMPAENEP